MIKEKYYVAIVGILSITSIVTICIIKGINGMLVASACGLIGSIVGYCFGKTEKEHKGE